MLDYASYLNFLVEDTESQGNKVPLWVVYEFFNYVRHTKDAKIKEQITSLCKSYSHFNTLCKNRKGLTVTEATQKLDYDVTNHEAIYPDEIEIVMANSKNEVKTYIPGVVDCVISNYRFIICGARDYVYCNGIYHEDPDGVILKNIISNHILSRQVNTRNINEAFNLISTRGTVQVATEKLDAYPPTWIPFKDAFLDLVTMKRIERSPDILSTFGLAYSMPSKKARKPERILAWLKQAIPDEDDLKIVLEYMGLCLCRYTGFQKMLIITGRAGSGKGTLLRLLQQVIGESLVSNVPLEKLSDRFYSGELVGKLANLNGDVSSESLKDPSFIKQLTGEDKVLTERKYEDPEFRQLSARYIFACNAVPDCPSEESDGLYRRLLIIRMDQRISNPDSHFLEQMEGEIPGFINVLIEHGHNLMVRGHFEESATSEQAKDEMRANHDMVYRFLAECVKEDEKSNVTKKMLYDNFKSYCARNNLDTLGRTHFYESMKAKGYPTYKKGGYEVYRGIRLLGPESRGSFASENSPWG